MTISTTDRTAGPFDGDGSNTQFPFAFKVFQAHDLAVYRTPEDQAPVLLALDADYHVTLNANQDANPGGAVELVAPLAVGYTLTIGSAVAALQPTALTNQGGFYPKVIEAALDRLTILFQQLGFSADGSGLFSLKQVLRYPELEGGKPLPIKSLRRNNLLAFDNDGNPFPGIPISDSAQKLRIDLANPTIGASIIGFIQNGPGALVRTMLDKSRERPSMLDFPDLQTAIAAAESENYVIGVTNDITVLIPSDAPTLQIAVNRLRPVVHGIKINLLIQSGHKLTKGLLVEANDYSMFLISSEDPVVYLDENFTGPRDGIGEEYTPIPNNLIVGDRAQMPVLNCLIDMEKKWGHGYRLVAGSRGEARARCGVINAGVCGIKGDASTFYGPATRWDGAGAAAIQCTLASTFSMQRAVWSNSFTGIVCSRGSRVHAQSGVGVNCTQYSVNAKRGFVVVENANLSGPSLNSIRAELQGQVDARGADLRGSIGVNILLYNGGIVTASFAKTDHGEPAGVDTSQGVLNTVDGRGIVFDSRSPKGCLPPRTITFTPRLECSTVAGSHSYTTAFGRVVKTGGIAHVYGYIQLSAWDASASGSVRIAGLPFDPYGPTSFSLQSGQIGRVGGITPPAGFCGFLVTSAGVNPFLNLRYQTNTGGVADVPHTSMSNTSLVLFSITLEIQSDLIL